jgi:hypothetical protein
MPCTIRGLFSLISWLVYNCYCNRKSSLTPIFLVRRKLQGRTLFTEADWHFLFGFPRHKVMTAAVWGRVLLANLIAIAVGFAIGNFLLPYGIEWFIAALALTTAAVIVLLLRYLRKGDWHVE